MAVFENAAAAALDPNNIRQVFNGVIELDFVGGKPQYRIGGKVFPSLKEAVRFKNMAGVSVVETFTPEKALVDYATTAAGVPSGDQIHQMMINYSKKGKVKIHLHHLKNEDIDPSNIDKILANFTDEKTGELAGYLNVGKSSTFEQWEDMEHPGRFLTSSEIIEKQKIIGTPERVFKNDVGSAAKRHKMDTRTAEFTRDFDRRLTVGVYDPRTFLQGSGLSGMDDISPQMAKMAQDGTSLLNPEIIDDIRKAKEVQRREYQAARDTVAKGSQEYMDITSEIRKITSKIEELRGVSVNGGLYNIRTDIFDVAASSHYSGALKDSMERLTGQLKGNTLVVPKRKNAAGRWMFDVAKEERGFSSDSRLDILTTAESIAQNKGEWAKGADRTSSIMLDARKIIKNNWLDTQSWAAHPGLFDTTRMQRHTLDAFQKQADNLVSTGQLPGGMISAFKDAIEKNTGVVGKSSASTLQAKAIIDFVESGGSLNQNPKMMEMALNSMAAFFTDGKNAGRSRFLVPNMVRHEVTDFANMRSSLLGTASLPALNDLEQGTITLDKTLGFGLHDKDISKYHEAFGGFDLDDMLAGHVRYDKDAKEYVLAMTRQPTDVGEIASFRFGEFDELAQQVLIQHDASYNFLDQIRDIDRAREKMYAAEDALMSDSSNGLSKSYKRLQKKVRDSQDRFSNVLGVNRDEYSMLDLESMANERIQALKSQHLTTLNQVVEHVSGDWRSSIDSVSRANKYMPDLYQLVQKEDGRDVAKPLTLKAENEFKEFELKTGGRTITDKELRGAFEVMVNGDNELGRYSNTKMIMNAMLKDNEEHMDEIVGVLGNGFFGVPELEDVIDSQIKNAGAGMTRDAAYSVALQEKIGQAAAILDAKGGPSLRLDKSIFYERTADESRSVIHAAYRAELKNHAGARGSFDDHLIDGGYSSLVEAQEMTRQSIEDIVQSLTGKVKYDEFYSKRIFSQQALDDAEFLTRAFHVSKETNKGVGPKLREIADSFLRYGDDILTGGIGQEEYSKKLARSKVGDDMLSAVGLIGERSGHEGIYDALGALQQMHNDAPRSEAARRARSILNSRGESGSMLDLLNSTDAHFGIRPGLVERDIDIAGLPRAPKHIAAAEKAFYGEKRLATSTIATKASQGIISIGEGISRLKEVPGVKTAAVVGLATVVGSFLYQHHKDHTEESMQGPPLLPGGSAYENLPVEAMQTGMGSRQDTRMGDTYSIHATGNFDHKEFSDSVSQVTGSPSSVSVYKSRNPKHQGSMDSYVGRRFN